MTIRFRAISEWLITIVSMKKLSLAGKCRLLFGAGIIVILTISLFIPYRWMMQLTDKAILDAGNAMSKTVYMRHFRPAVREEGTLAPLDESGVTADEPVTYWYRLTKTSDIEKQYPGIDERQLKTIDYLCKSDGRYETLLPKEAGVDAQYLRLVRATESCITCHNAQGPAAVFNQNEVIGAIVVKNPGREISKAMFMNRIWVIVAGLIGGIGAIIIFYVITQRIILSPIRQLRAIANNVAEGNLDVRSKINTNDEYERLSDAFNHMLDGLQSSQIKLRETNKQLDSKIAELSDRNIELFKANKLKSEFLANISHEFRTPLNAILGFAQILREKPETLIGEKGQRYAQNIITSGRSLLNMINDLLMLAKSEAGKIQVWIDKTSIQELGRGLVAFFSPMTEQKKIKVKLSIDEGIPLVQTDQGKVQQILYNFFSNAIKFTPEKGRIEISAKMLDDNNVRIAVSDTGCGIPDAHHEHVFEKFRQSDGSITRRTTGSGLGLSICKELAALLAGSIGLESEKDKGSTFWLDIPVILNKKDDPDAERQGD